MLITSRQNAGVQLLRRTARGRRRRPEDPCYVEGIQCVLRAVDNGLTPDLLVYAPALLRSAAGLAAVAAAEAGDCGAGRVLAVTPEVFASFSVREHPTGLAALVRPRLTALGDLCLAGEAILVVLQDVGNPGNLGTIVRTVDGLAGRGVILTGNTADAYDPASVRASVGTVFGVPTVQASSIDEVLTWCRESGVQVVTTSARAERDVAAGGFRAPCALLLGSESEGLAAPILAAGDLQVRIPMHGQASSLNLAVAAGILLYEARRSLR